MGELIITGPDGTIEKILVNTEAPEHVVDDIIKRHLDFYAPTEEYLVDYIDLY